MIPLTKMLQKIIADMKFKTESIILWTWWFMVLKAHKNKLHHRIKTWEVKKNERSECTISKSTMRLSYQKSENMTDIWTLNQHSRFLIEKIIIIQTLIVFQHFPFDLWCVNPCDKVSKIPCHQKCWIYNSFWANTDMADVDNFTIAIGLENYQKTIQPTLA